MEDCDVDADVDVRDPDEKSIMTYVAQFLQYSRDLPVAEEDVQVCITVCCLHSDICKKKKLSQEEFRKIKSCSHLDVTCNPRGRQSYMIKR